MVVFNLINLSEALSFSTCETLGKLLNPLNLSHLFSKTGKGSTSFRGPCEAQSGRCRGSPLQSLMAHRHAQWVNSAPKSPFQQDSPPSNRTSVFRSLFGPALTWSDPTYLSSLSQAAYRMVSCFSSTRPEYRLTQNSEDECSPKGNYMSVTNGMMWQNTGSCALDLERPEFKLY